MKVKATLYIRKEIWIEEEVEVQIEGNNRDELDDAIQEAFDSWQIKQEDYGDHTIGYELDDWGWEILDRETSEG